MEASGGPPSPGLAAPDRRQEVLLRPRTWPPSLQATPDPEAPGRGQVDKDHGHLELRAPSSPPFHPSGPLDPRLSTPGPTSHGPRLPLQTVNLRGNQIRGPCPACAWRTWAGPGRDSVGSYRLLPTSLRAGNGWPRVTGLGGVGNATRSVTPACQPPTGPGHGPLHPLPPR